MAMIDVCLKSSLTTISIERLRRRFYRISAFPAFVNNCTYKLQKAKYFFQFCLPFLPSFLLLSTRLMTFDQQGRSLQHKYWWMYYMPFANPARCPSPLASCPSPVPPVSPDEDQRGGRGATQAQRKGRYLLNFGSLSCFRH